MCSETLNRTTLNGSTNNALTHVNCSSQIESCSKLFEHVLKDHDVGWSELNYALTGVGLLCLAVILAIVSWAVVYTKRRNKAAQKKETIDDNPEYGSEDSDQDGETNIVDKNDYYEM